MAEKETPNERRLREEQELDKLSLFGISGRYGPMSTQTLIEKIKGNDGYGTSRSAGARYAGGVEERRLQNEGMRIGDILRDSRPRQVTREAAAEERREARGMKKGGKVNSASKRADGIAQRGKTKGRMV